MAYWESNAARASDFRVGDWVVRYDSIFPGKVVGVHVGINQIDVEYQTGWEREEPEELIKITLFGVVPTSHSARRSHRLRSRSKINQRRFIQMLHTMKKDDALPIHTSSINVLGQEKKRPSLSDEARLFVLGDAYLSSQGLRRAKIASQIANNYSSFDWDCFRKTCSFNKAYVDPSTLPTYARMSFHLKRGGIIRIVANFQNKKFQLLLNNRVVRESARFNIVQKTFKRLKKRDKRHW